MKKKVKYEMKALQAYLDKKNQWNAIFWARGSKHREFEIKTAKGRQEVAGCLDSDLSPENLACDGELSSDQVNARYRELTAVARDLLKLDPAVKFYEYSCDATGMSGGVRYRTWTPAV